MRSFVSLRFDIVAIATLADLCFLVDPSYTFACVVCERYEIVVREDIYPLGQVSCAHPNRMEAERGNSENVSESPPDDVSKQDF
jgi:hypothetical protein